MAKPNQHLHGRSFSAKIIDTEVTGRISVSPVTGFAYLCQDEMDGSDLASYERFGYKYGWLVDFDDEVEMKWISGFKLLPPAEEYHKLFVKLAASLKNTWEEDGSYSVVPKEVLGEIANFLNKGL